MSNGQFHQYVLLWIPVSLHGIAPIFKANSYIFYSHLGIKFNNVSWSYKSLSWRYILFLIPLRWITHLYEEMCITRHPRNYLRIERKTGYRVITKYQKRMNLLKNFCTSECYSFNEHSTTDSYGDSSVLTTTIEFQ